MPKKDEEVKSVGKCAGCGKALTAYVVAGGEKYCSDACAEKNA